jgi:uncharacterized protein
MAHPDSADVIQPDRLTAKGIVFEGSLSPDELEGLDDLVAGPEGELNYRVEARLDRQQRRIVSCRISGFVTLACQATGELFRHPVMIDDHLVLVAAEAELPPFEAESDESDYVVAAGPMPVQDLVEEAVVLALPMVPRKPGTESSAAEAVGAEKDPSPFAALGSLKSQKK